VERVFLNANVLFSAAYSETNTLRQLWSLDQIELISCPLAIQEANKNLARKRPHRLEDYYTLMASITTHPDPSRDTVYPADIELPWKDALILLSAIDAQAHFFVTGNSTDFGPYFGVTVGRTKIETPAMYLHRHRHKS
jgi:hypothetical protein